MKILEIDAGNTRIKWRLQQQAGSAYETMSSGLVLATEKSTRVPEQFTEQMQGLRAAELQSIQAIRASNVRGAPFAKALASFCEAHFAVPVDFAVVGKHQAGVHNAYQNPGALGVDRWLAMLAAYQSCQAAVCVVDCGSALTVDLVADDGTHEGGFIVPGLHLMKLSLGSNTADLGYRPENDFTLDPGKNTGEAIDHGILTMALGMLEHIYSNRGRDKNWYLCGGDAELLSSFIGWPHQVKPELVLDGLVFACGQSGESI